MKFPLGGLFSKVWHVVDGSKTIVGLALLEVVHTGIVPVATVGGVAIKYAGNLLVTVGALHKAKKFRDRRKKKNA